MWDLFMGVVSIGAGCLLLLYKRGALPRSTDKPEKWAEWREQWSSVLTWVPPVLLAVGVFRLATALLHL